MKVSVNTDTRKRKLVALIGATGDGVYIPTSNGSRYIDKYGVYDGNHTLEVLIKDTERTPVYEGDSITIQF